MTSVGWTIRVDQYSSFLLRFCNLATILNLALVTLHEYVYICYPLRYSSMVTRFVILSRQKICQVVCSLMCNFRTRVMIVVVITWVCSASVTLANSVIGSLNSSILIDKDCETGTVSSHSTNFFYRRGSDFFLCPTRLQIQISRRILPRRLASLLFPLPSNHSWLLPHSVSSYQSTYQRRRA